MLYLRHVKYITLSRARVGLIWYGHWTPPSLPVEKECNAITIVMVKKETARIQDQTRHPSLAFSSRLWWSIEIAFSCHLWNWRTLNASSQISICLLRQGLVRELIDFNLRRGSPQVRVEVRTLLCILTKDNPRATDEMNSLLMTRIGAAIRGHLSNPELVSVFETIYENMFRSYCSRLYLQYISI